MAAAVSLESPVITITRTPASWHCIIASATSGLAGSYNMIVAGAAMVVARIGDTLTPLELHPSFFGKLLEIRVVIFGAGKCPLRENYLKLE